MHTACDCSCQAPKAARQRRLRRRLVGLNLPNGGDDPGLKLWRRLLGMRVPHVRTSVCTIVCPNACTYVRTYKRLFKRLYPSQCRFPATGLVSSEDT